ncbi:hypothetical protein DB895_10690 [Flavobacterium psychrotolerans]|uniref:Signal peptidase n=1 Tax=Flavobacterium psychrotolerans TaxID=2169410 RepID=A0A2U1JHG5_9FLAO|nr:hypothetical protein DB895_10690 [Flavobacterium psychrotolerans]
MNKILSVLVFISASAYAAPKEPPPPGTPPPPGLPIDGDWLGLLIMAMLFGLYKIYEFKLKTKTPM